MDDLVYYILYFRLFQEETLYFFRRSFFELFHAYLKFVDVLVRGKRFVDRGDAFLDLSAYVIVCEILTDYVFVGEN